MKTAAVAVAVLALAGSAAAAPTGERVAYVHDGSLVVLDLSSGTSTVVMRNAPPYGPVAWSGDGKLVSDAGRIPGGPTLPTTHPVWAREGETAAYLTGPYGGAVRLWTPHGSRTILPASWGARTLAWGPGGELAIGRQVHVHRGPFTHQEVWVWHAGALRRVAGPWGPDATPIVEGFDPRGRVLWWSDRFESASVLQDGVELSANRTPLDTTLVWSDTVQLCGDHLVYQRGGDRYTTKGKSIVYDGRDVSRDARLSWVSPSCNGTEVVAAAGRNWWERRFGEEARSLWELVPTRERLTRPRAGWTDEFPSVLPDGSVLFVRSRSFADRTAAGWVMDVRAGLDLLRGGAVEPLASLSLSVNESDAFTPNWYGHYAWPQLVAVTA